MDDYWLDAARPPRLRNWWELGTDPEQAPEYPAIGLEGFKPDPPPTIGFNVPATPTDPMGDFARSWLPPEAGGTVKAEAGAVPPTTAGSGQDGWGKAFDLAALSRVGTDAARAAAGDIATMARSAAPELATVGRWLPFGAGLPLAAATAATIAGAPTFPKGQTLEIGDDIRLDRPPGQDMVNFQQARDRGLFRTGLLRSWEPVEKNSVTSEIFGRPELSPERIRSTFGERGSLKAMDAITSAIPTQEEIAKEREQALEGATEAQRERMRACWEVQQRLEELGASSREFPGARQAAVGVSVHPDLHEPSAGLDRSTDNLRHKNGMVGEYKLANELVTARPDEKIFHFVNVPGWHGPDVLSIGPDENFMGWDAKSRQDPTYITQGMAQKPTLNGRILRRHIDREVKAGRLDPDLAERAWKNFENGNYNLCTAPADKAFGSWVELRRGDKTIVKSR